MILLHSLKGFLYFTPTSLARFHSLILALTPTSLFFQTDAQSRISFLSHTHTLAHLIPFKLQHNHISLFLYSKQPLQMYVQVYV